jgi:membrane protease YdiL (CAAX protease family)
VLSELAAPQYGWQFIDLAGLGVNTGRSYAAALLRIVLYPLAAAVVLALALFNLPNRSGGHTPLDAVFGILGQFGLIVAAGAAVLRGVVRSHRRPWRSLVTSDLAIDWRRLAIGLGVQLAILAGEFVAVAALTGLALHARLPAVLPVVLLALFLIPLQSASEEVLFRGYLTQAAGRLVRSRALIALIVALLFGVLHLNIHGSLTMLYFAVFSLILSAVSLRDDRLELAIGGHTGVNLFGFAAGGLLQVAPAAIGLDSGAMAFNWVSIAVLVVNGGLFYGLTRLLVRVFCKPRSTV